MYRVVVAIILTLLAVQLSGCTGSLRLGSEVHVVGIADQSARA